MTQVRMELLAIKVKKDLKEIEAFVDQLGHKDQQEERDRRDELDYLEDKGCQVHQV